MEELKTKRDKIDDIFSKLVRERANWTCEHSGKYFPEGQRQGLHCSHYFSRRHQATRYDPNNAFAHSFSSHQSLGEDPGEFYRWYVATMGGGMEEMIREKAHSIKKRTKVEKEDLYQHLKEQYRIMLEKRADGVTGRIEFEGYD